MSKRSLRDLNDGDRALAEAAIAVLRDNDRPNAWGRHTIPSGHLYPHQWAWDSAFAAIGWRHVDPDRALVELEVLMKGAWPDGRVPHIYFHDLSGEYFPGPEFWKTERSTSITQPPIWATAALQVFESLPDVERFTPLVHAMARSHTWFAEHRDPSNWGAVAVVHPWESGLDNCPAWDAPMQAVDPSRAPAFKRVDIDRVDDPSERPTDDDYKRYAVMVHDIAADGFGPGSGFAVYDPLMTAILARGEQDLAELARKCGLTELASEADARADRLRAGLRDHLWRSDLGRFIYYDAIADAPITVDVIGGYVPLMLDWSDEITAALKSGLAARYDVAHPLPSTAPDTSPFDARRYWRGPTWINIDWLLAPHVDGVREKATELVRSGGFREYYQPLTGEGLGAKGFAWTAALVLDWLLEG
ncbi:MAG: MGH1-like glycoside hydrolase domain-containing protein [Bradymonadia bacterium]